MKATDLIAELHRMVAMHGDLECVAFNRMGVYGLVKPSAETVDEDDRGPSTGLVVGQGVFEF